MQEDFLHYIWKYKKFDTNNLKTTKGESIIIHSSGAHNHNSGPDFFNAKIEINNQLWAGNVEIHVKTNDWFVHHHEDDPAYDNVILHVVWEDDGVVYRKDNTTIPTLQLNDCLSEDLMDNYKTLFSKKEKWINCEYGFAEIDDFVIQNWLEKLYIERLERKYLDIETLLKKSKNDWEAVLFKMLSRSFGLKVNGDAFYSLANSFDFSILRKIQSNLIQLEALFFGQLRLLETDNQDPYVLKLQNEYKFLKQKFRLENDKITPVQFFRLRPSNFPTIRLSQLANVYHQSQNLFFQIINASTKEDIYNLFLVQVSPFWEVHYTINKISKKSRKRITESFIDLLIINTIIPLKFCYARHRGQQINEIIIQLVRSISSEKNSTIDSFNKLKKVSKSALDSQALIQLKQQYCDVNKCLQCDIGNTLLSNN